MQSARFGVRDAKMYLSKILKMVQNGTEVILMDRGRPVGKIVPIQQDEMPLESRIKTLEDMGVIEMLPKNGGGRLPPPIPVPDNIAQRFLKEDRDDG